MGLDPDALHTGGGGRMFGRRAGCPGLHGEPDVRASRPDAQADGAGYAALWIDLSRFLGARPDVRDLARSRMSGVDAGCPTADAVGRPLGQPLCVYRGAGCPASGPDVRPL